MNSFRQRFIWSNPRKTAISQPPQMKASVEVNDLSRAIGEVSHQDCAHRQSHIFWLAPPPLRNKPLSDEPVIFLLYPRVRSVSMMPGRSSKTCIPSSARRRAQSCVTIANPAFEIQYSPRLREAVLAEIDELKMILNPCDRAGLRFFPSASSLQPFGSERRGLQD